MLHFSEVVEYDPFCKYQTNDRMGSCELCVPQKINSLLHPTTAHTSFGSLLGIARKTPQTTRAGVVPARPLAKSAGHLTLSGSGDQHVLSPAEKKLQQDEEELTEMTRSFGNDRGFLLFSSGAPCLLMFRTALPLLISYTLCRGGRQIYRLLCSRWD